MVQHLFSGSSATAFLSSLTPSSLSELEEGSSTLSVLLNEEGGIIDDLMLTKLRAAEDGKDKEGGEGWYVVTNAGRRKEDLEWIGKKMDAWNKGVSEGNEVKWERLDGWGLIALQGPSLCLQRSLTPQTRALPFLELTCSPKLIINPLSD
jgi:aminomethyltransferase